MAVIVGAQVQRQLVEQFGIERGVVQKRLGRGGQNVERLADQVRDSARGHAGPRRKQRQGPMALVIVGLALRPGLEDGNGPMPDEVVEPGEDGLDRGPRLRGAQHENGLEDARQEEGAEDIDVGEVGEQVLVGGGGRRAAPRGWCRGRHGPAATSLEGGAAALMGACRGGCSAHRGGQTTARLGSSGVVGEELGG